MTGDGAPRLDRSVQRVVVAGGAGFIGAHLCARLVGQGIEVLCVDNLVTGDLANLDEIRGDARFSLFQHDVTEGLALDGQVDAVVHLASPASPNDYLRLPLETLRAGSIGTQNCLELALAKDARFLLASTSEVYGEPEVHPQTEDYWGNVNPIGPRSVYDEAKRFSEALTMAYHRAQHLDVGIARIFNTYGPKMRPTDGRVISNLITQALSGRPLTIYGDGSQTRSFCYVDDLVAGLICLLFSDVTGPVNLGNPLEVSIRDLAEMVLQTLHVELPIEFEPLPPDDPTRRRPDISRACQQIGWRPEIGLAEGLEQTARWFAQRAQSASR